MTQQTPTPEQLLQAIIQNELTNTDPLHHLTPTDWHQKVLPNYFPKGYAPYHTNFWNWAANITTNTPPQPWFSMWGRGLAKSTNAEAATIYLAARQQRRYWLYICGTQQQADDHVGTIAAMLETPTIETHYPNLANPKIGKHGNQKGWRRNRVWTQNGFVVDALGLDSAVRGAKLEEQRPDGAVFDDIDDRNDTPETVHRKEGTIAATILPALTPNAAIIIAQNYTHLNSIAARLEDGRADYLANRILSGPHPAIAGMEVQPNPNYNPTNPNSPTHLITAGEPTWPSGMNTQTAEMQITRIGLHHFETESNNKRANIKGALWNTDLLDQTRQTTPPPQWDRIAIGVDPNKTGRGDDAGIITAATTTINDTPHAYILKDSSQLTAPSEWRNTAADDYLTHNAACFVVERTGLGEHAKLTLQDAPALKNHTIQIEPVDAKLGKEDRARPIAQLFKDNRVHLLGHHPYLEQQLTTWIPGKGKSPGAIDAMVHVITHLLIDPQPTTNWTPDTNWATTATTKHNWNNRP